MKYIDLKKNLKIKLENSYLIFGDDRYLCYDALKKIEESVDVKFKDMNSITLDGDNITAKQIVECANVYPFADNYRFVVVKNFSPAKNKDEFNTIQNYLLNPLSSTVIVFLNLDNSEFFKGMKNLTSVDCSKIDAKYISSYIINVLAKNNIGATDDAINDLIIYCNSDMLKISNELEKLVAFTMDSKVLTSDIVKQFVNFSKDYQAFELAEYIASGDSKSAINLVESFMVKSGAGFQLLSPLYNNYRRALFVSLNKDKTTAELAKLLLVKEFAIKMLNKQVNIFTPKQLKQIVDMIAEYDKKIKMGEMKEATAIKVIVFNILNIRGKNGQ